MLQLAVFAIGIMPYITASIIVQLLTVVIPVSSSCARRPVRPGQDDAVHPLPDGGAGVAAVHGHRRPGLARPALPDSCKG